MTVIKVPAKVTRKELEAAFPWVCYLPVKAMEEFMARIDSYREAAKIYSRQNRKLAP